MDLSKYVNEYTELLGNLSKTKFFGNYAITHYLSKQELRATGIKTFILKTAWHILELWNWWLCRCPKEEHPKICGGVTEYITKINSKKTRKKLEDLNFWWSKQG